ncbi:MAG: hypothetical protein A2W26_00080 [Acidobacteria bacterium RBG_16_64_8]|nr:MAG: hypothetical protein A2W26_00080 [Acidobacteria bacterium RBG_16_64_8]
MPNIELKDLGQLEGFLNEQSKRLDEIGTKILAIPDADGPGGHKKLAEQIAAQQKILDELVRHRVPITDDEGKQARLVSKADYMEMGIKAIYQAPTAASITPTPAGPSRFSISRPEGPIAEFQDAGEKLYLLGQLLKVGDETAEHAARRSKFYTQVYAPAREKAVTLVKQALDTATGPEGGDWLANEVSARMFELLRLEKNVWGLFEEITMPRSPFTFPTFLSKIKAFKMTEATGSVSPTKISIGQPTTTATKFTLTAIGIATRMLTSKFLEEDSIVPVLSLLQAQVAEALSDGREDACLNGDDDGTHMDTDTQAGATDLPAKAWNGLRKAALAKAAKVDLGGSKLDTDANWKLGVGVVRGAMGKYGRGRECGFITGSKLSNGQVPYVEAYRTAYAIAASATNVAGNISFRPDGMEMVESEYQREDVNSSGVNGASGNTFATAIIVHRKAWICGTVRQATVQVGRELYMESDQDVVVATGRWAFGSPYGAGAGDNHTGIIYDIGV